MSNGTPSPGKDEIFDRTARLVMTSVNDADMEAFLLSYPMVLTPKNDLALLWAEEYRKACSWRLDGDTRKKHHAERILEFMRIWAKNYPNDFTPASRKAVLDVLTKETGGNAALLNEFKLLFLKRQANPPAAGSAQEPTTTTGGGDSVVNGNASGGLGTRGGSGVRLFRSGSLTARGTNGAAAAAVSASLTSSTHAGSLTAREYKPPSGRAGADDNGESRPSTTSATAGATMGPIQASLSGGSLDKMFASRRTGKKQRSATIGGGPLPQLASTPDVVEFRERPSLPSPRAQPPSSSSSSSFLSSSLSSSHASPPASPRTTAMIEGRRLNKEHSLSTNNVRNAIIVAASAGAGAGAVPPINLHEVRKKDQINLKEKDQKTIKKIRSASLNRQHQQTSSIPLISPRVDKGRLKDMVKDLGKRKKLLDFSTASLARELTMQEWEIFKRIAPREFLNQAWQRENKAIIAPNIIRMIGRFNQISYWVATEVLTKQDRKTQVKIIKKFIKTAYICYHLGNFNSMMEILSGLNNISISRLKDTWRQVPEKYKAYFEELEAVMDNQQNFHRYREQLAKREEAREPTLPYFGLFLRYFTYLDDGNPAYGPDKCINIGAMELRLEHVQKVMKYQSIPYNLSRNVHVQNFLNNLHVVEDEDKLYAMSLASQAPSNAHPDQLAPEPEAQMFAEDMIATGRTTAGFSHNRPFLPNDNPDETRDDISEEMSSSFLDITTTTTEASTLEREEDGTELSTIDSDFEDEEELRLEEKVARLRQQILAARAHKEQLAQKVIDLRRQRGFDTTATNPGATSPDKEKEVCGGGSSDGGGGAGRPRAHSAAAEQRLRILREVGHARRVNTLDGAMSPRRFNDQLQLRAMTATATATATAEKAKGEGDSDSTEAEEEFSSGEAERTKTKTKTKPKASRRRQRRRGGDEESESSEEDTKSEEESEEAEGDSGEGTTSSDDQEESDSESESESDSDSESESESDDESEEEESSETDEDDDDDDDDDDEFECESESASSSSSSTEVTSESDDPAKRNQKKKTKTTKKKRLGHKPSSSSKPSSHRPSSSKSKPTTRPSLASSPLHHQTRHQQPSSQATTPRTSGVYIPPLYFASSTAGEGSGSGSGAANRQHGRERERDPYAQYISPRVPNTLPYSPRRPSLSASVSPPSTAVFGGAPPSIRSGGSGIRLKKETRSRPGGGGSHGSSSQRGGRESGEMTMTMTRDVRMEKTSSFRFFAHLSEGVPEVMKQISPPAIDVEGGHKRTTVPMRGRAREAALHHQHQQRRRPTSLSKSDVGTRHGTEL